MTRASRCLTIAFALSLCGCGYQEYMNRFEDTLAENDYADKVEKALGSRVSDSARGFTLRLPQTVAIEPTLASSTETDEAPVVETGEEETATVHHAVFDTPPDTPIPLRVVIFVSRPTREHRGFLDATQLAQFAADPSTRSEWMGDGVLVSEEFQLEPRDVPAGPKLKMQSPKRISIKWSTLTLSTDGDEEQIWYLGFIEQPSATAMVGYRVSKSNYSKAYGGAAEDGTTSTVADAIDMSLTTVQIEAAPGSSAAPTEGRTSRRGT